MASLWGSILANISKDEDGSNWNTTEVVKAKTKRGEGDINHISLLIIDTPLSFSL